MSKVCNVLGLRKTAGLFGIEVEAEGNRLGFADDDFWRTEDDPSLRGRYPEGRAEFVLRKPIPFEHVEQALDDLILCQAKAKLDFSFRTSVHVHLNCQEMEHPKLMNLIYAYLLIEDPLINFCGEVRKANRFCLRAKDAEGLYDAITNIFQGEETEIGRIPQNSFRYSALNLEALKKYGSVEFRAMRGTLDKNVLMPWVSMIHSLYTFAQKEENPQAIRELYETLGGQRFLERVLSKPLAEMLEYDGIEKDMNQSYCLSVDLPYAFNRGEKIRARYEERVKQMEAVMVAPKVRVKVPPAWVADPAVIRWDEVMQAPMAPPPIMPAPAAVRRAVIRAEEAIREVQEHEARQRARDANGRFAPRVVVDELEGL